MVIKKAAPVDEVRQSFQSANIVHRYKPDARECALLVLELMRLKEEESGRDVSRFRIAEISLRRLWCRNRISPDLIEQVVEWLAGAGVALFYAGSTYAVIRTSTIESWTRVTSKRLVSELALVTQGAFDFSGLEHLLAAPDTNEEG